MSSLSTWYEAEEPQRRSWLAAFVYWNRRNKYYMGGIRKAIWWIRFGFIGALPFEGLIDILSTIPLVGTVLLPADAFELPPEGVGLSFLAWLIVKFMFKLVFRFPKTWRAVKEIRDMRDMKQYQPIPYARWAPHWLPD